MCMKCFAGYFLVYGTCFDFDAGDPTTFGNLPPPSLAIDSVIEGVKSTKYNGYAPSAGYKESREAVARYLTKNGSETKFEVSMPPFYRWELSKKC